MKMARSMGKGKQQLQIKPARHSTSEREGNDKRIYLFKIDFVIRVCSVSIFTVLWR